MSARLAEKFTHVIAVKVSDDGGALTRSMQIKANNMIIKERVCVNCVISESVL